MCGASVPGPLGLEKKGQGQARPEARRAGEQGEGGWRGRHWLAVWRGARVAPERGQARGGRNDPTDAESGSEQPEPLGDRAQSVQFPCAKWLRARRHLAKRWTGGDE